MSLPTWFLVKSNFTCTCICIQHTDLYVDGRTINYDIIRKGGRNVDILTLPSSCNF